jgi:hypothetical protein
LPFTVLMSKRPSSGSAALRRMAAHRSSRPDVV